MLSEVRLKKNTEQLKEGLKSSISGPQNLGSGGARAPRAPLDPLVGQSLGTYHEGPRQIVKKLSFTCGLCRHIYCLVLQHLRR